MSIKLIFPLPCLLGILLSFATIIISCKWLSRRLKRNNTTPPLPPAPTTYPIIGCLPHMIFNKPTHRWIHKTMHHMKTEIACFRFGNSVIIPVTSPELACEFLKKHDAVFASRPYVTSAKLVSNGYLATVLSPYGDQWKKMRRVVVSEVLSSSMHRKLLDKRCEEADELVRCVFYHCQSPLNNGLVNVRSVGQHYCGNVIKKMIFNRRYFGMETRSGGPGSEDIEHLEAMFRVLSYVYGFPIADFIPWLEVFDFDGHKQAILEAVSTMRKYQDFEIDQRIELWQKGVKKDEEDILDKMINLKDPKNGPLLTSQEIKAQINEMMLATIDHPSNVAEWSLAEMINQPDILEKAYKELDQVVGRNRLVQESDIPKLNYIKACAKESYRLHPAAPFNLPHVAVEDVVVGGYFIPKGSQVLVSRLGLGRNPRVWEDPYKYNPARHMVENHQCAKEVTLFDDELRILSFSIGRRGCPAVLLGSTITTMILARLLQGFYWKAPPGSPTVDLSECENGDMLMKNPLVAHVTPRLPQQVYLQLI